MTAQSTAPGFVIVGASLAGVRAAEAARRAGYSGTITLVGEELHLPYDRPPLSKEFLAEGVEVDYHLTAEELRGLDVSLRLGARATGLDPERRVLRLGEEEIPYEQLLIATGAAPRTLPQLPELSGIRTLRTLDDAVALRAEISESSEVVVIGAGFIGSEIASSAHKLGATVTIIEAAPAPLVRAVGEVIGEAISRLHPRNGVRLLCGVQIEEVEGTDRVESVRLSNGEVIPADLLIVGVGAAPATAWLADSGIELHPADGGVVCNELLETSLPGVYAAGDVAHWPNQLMEMTMRLENWTNAADQAARAATNAVAPDRAAAYETVPYFWSDWYGQRIQFVGSAIADSVSYASGGPDEDRFIALYRSGDRLVGAATLNEPRKIMKLRRLIAERGSWDAAAELLDSTAVVR